MPFLFVVGGQWGAGRSITELAMAILMAVLALSSFLFSAPSHAMYTLTMPALSTAYMTIHMTSLC